MSGDEYTIDVDESQLHAVECVADDCGSITIGVGYEAKFCAACGVNQQIQREFAEDEGDE